MGGRRPRRRARAGRAGRARPAAPPAGRRRRRAPRSAASTTSRARRGWTGQGQQPPAQRRDGAAPGSIAPRRGSSGARPPRRPGPAARSNHSKRPGRPARRGRPAPGTARRGPRARSRGSRRRGGRRGRAGCRAAAPGRRGCGRRGRPAAWPRRAAILRDLQRRQARPGRVRGDAGQARVDHRGHAVDGDRGLGHVGGEDDLAPRGRAHRAVLLLGREVAVERQHVEPVVGRARASRWRARGSRRRPAGRPARGRPAPRAAARLHGAGHALLEPVVGAGASSGVRYSTATSKRRPSERRVRRAEEARPPARRRAWPT